MPVGRQERKEHSVLGSQPHQDPIREASLAQVDSLPSQEGLRGTTEADCSCRAQLFRESVCTTAEETCC